MKTCVVLVALLSIVGVMSVSKANAQTTAFTYQGQLTENGSPANGIFDLRFSVFDSPVSGSIVGSPITNSPTAVTNGLFAVTLDFETVVFDGGERWLEIGARRVGDGEFTTLSPRQEITATPYALRALTANTVPPGVITAANLAPGSAAANLMVSGLSAVASGGVVMSTQEYASNLFNEGYVRIGQADLIPEKWRALTNGPPLGAFTALARRQFAAVWTGTEMIVWGGEDDSGPLNTGGRYDPASDTWTPMSLNNAPSPQGAPSAVWTGSQLIVWGNSGPVRGGRYNPSTDTWLPVDEANAPAPRTLHSTVWTGTEMIIWGGNGSAGFLNTGGRYNPVNNTWDSTTLSSAPSIRGQHSAVWTGTEMIIWGGRETHSCGFICVTTTNYVDGARYNPISDSWQPMTTANAPLKRYAHSAVWTGAEMIVWGGLHGEGTFALGTNINTGARYNPANNTWTAATQTTGAPSPRDSQAAHWTGTGMLIWGGMNQITNFSDGAVYDPANNTWNPINNSGAPPPRVGYSTVWTGDDMIVWGGEELGEAGSFDDHLVEIGRRYHLATDSWSLMAPSGDPSARAGHSAVWTGTEMLVWGGTGGEFALHTGGRFNPSRSLSNAWSSINTTGAPSARFEHTAVWTGSEMIIWGGSNGSTALNTGARFSPASNTWLPVSTVNAPTPRSRHVAVWTGSEMLIWGGMNGSTFQNNGARYNPVSNTWQALPVLNAPTARAEASAIWTGDEMIVWGGRNAVSSLNTGARFRPASNSWQPLPTAGAPSARAGHTAVWTGSEMIIWGGVTNGPDAGGRYDPKLNQWSPLSLENVPISRIAHTAIWDGTEMIIWGGFDGTNSLATGGRYDPIADSWTATATTNSVMIRDGHSSVWTGTEMVVWGGHHTFSGNEGYLDDAQAYTPPRTMYFYLKP